MIDIELEDLTKSEYLEVTKDILDGLKKDSGTISDRWDIPIIKNNRYSIIIHEYILKYIKKKFKDKVGSRIEDESEKIQKFKDKINK